MANLWALFVTVITGINVSGAYKILVYFPFPSTSHGILGDAFVRHLLSAGHEVTYVTPFVKDNPHSKLRQIDVSSTKSTLPNFLHLEALLKKETEVKDHNFIFNVMLNISTHALHHPEVQRLTQDSKEQYDLVIAEWMFTEVYCGLAVVFSSPCILFFPTEFHNGALSIIDDLPNPAYTPLMQLASSPPFTFVERVQSLFFHSVAHLTKIYKFMPRESNVYESALKQIAIKRGLEFPSYEEMRHNISLIIYNSHISLGANVRSPPNYIPIGGYHINTDVKPLPADLQKIMDESTHGVIYFSMGSNLQSKELPEELKKGLLKMFGSLKQTVLWKFEELLPNLPKNLHILKWAPQPSILSHPNCVLFITHGGLLSTTETVHFGKPIIGVPVFADQFSNVDRAVRSGFAKRVDLTYSLSDDLKLAIEDILSDPKYTERVKELSLIYHDRPVSPGRELVHWVEHVVRTRGAPHLRSPALHMPFYQKMYLDLAALIIGIVLLIRVLIKQFYFKRALGSKAKKNKSKKNN